jgi:hypothetical protein
MAKKHLEIVATIQDDFTVKVHVPRLLKAVLASIGAGELVRIDIAKWYKKRTLKQNATSWGPDYELILQFIATKTGEIFSEEQLHDFHKRKILGYEESELAAGLIKPKSTTDLNTVEFAEFRERYCQYWAERGLFIPDPKPKGEGG